jgi:aconitate hydratase
MLVGPLPPEEAGREAIVKGPNIASLPDLEPLPERLEVTVLLKVGDNLSTDEILPAGARVLPFRSNIPRIAEFAFDMVDQTYPERALALRERGGHAVVAGANYGQGSSREHAALAPRFLGLRVVLARGFGRIHAQNLVNFGVLPLLFAEPGDYDTIALGDVIEIAVLRRAVRGGPELTVYNRTKGWSQSARHTLSPRQVEVILAGGLVNWMKRRLGP